MLIEIPDDQVELLRRTLWLGQQELQIAWERELVHGDQEAARRAWQAWSDARYLLLKLSLA